MAWFLRFKFVIENSEEEEVEGFSSEAPSRWKLPFIPKLENDDVVALEWLCPLQVTIPKQDTSKRIKKFRV